MNDFEIAEIVCINCPYRFTCCIPPSSCPDCLDIVGEDEEEIGDFKND